MIIIAWLAAGWTERKREMVSSYLDKSIRNCKTRKDLKLILAKIASVPRCSISGYAEAFYCTASIAYNTYYSELAKDTLVYFNKIRYIDNDEMQGLEDIISNSVNNF